jgi:amidophosphoribosyltransferase
MSDAIKHECGVAFIRLRKPLSYFNEKYGSPWYGLHKLQFMMTKQLNRGQDGAGIGVVKLNPNYGDRYLARQRSASKTALGDIFEEVFHQLKHIPEALPLRRRTFTRTSSLWHLWGKFDRKHTSFPTTK